MRSKVFIEKAGFMPPLPMIAILAAGGLGVLNVVESSMLESASAIWLWGAAIFLPYYLEHGDFGPHYRKPACKVTGIAFLLLSIVLSYSGYFNTAIAFLIFAPMLYFGNFKIFAVAAIPVFIWTAIIPKTEYVHFLISYPLRIIGADMAAALLAILGFAASASETIVNIGGRDVAITAACSGVEQLEAMLFVGWIIATCMHSKTWIRVAHFAMILPIILLINSLRLTVTLGGNEKFGDFFLSDGFHTASGFAAVAVIVGIFIASGFAFPRKMKEAK